jgi:hypothetical protein
VATVSSRGSASGTADLSSTTGLSQGQTFDPTIDITSSNGTGNAGASTVQGAIINGTKIFYIDEAVGVIVVASQ